MRLRSITNVDKYIRIINYEYGPRFCDFAYVRANAESLRRLGNTYFAQNFYVAAARSACVSEASIARERDRERDPRRVFSINARAN